MSEDSIVAILADQHIVDEMCDHFLDPIQKDSVRRVYTQKLYEVHKIDSVRYTALYEYLEKDLDTYREIGKKVHERLKELQGED